jgi:uncharacterized protein (TIGR02145 family)
MATSEADGSFSLTGYEGTLIRANQPSPQRQSVVIHNGVLSINATGNSALEITIYDLKGQAIASTRKRLDVGTNLLLLPRTGTGIFLYRVKIDKNEFLIKGTSVSGVVGGNEVSLQNHSAQAMVTLQINDTIAVKKTGYLNYRCVQIPSDTTGLQIKLIACADTVKDIDGNVYQAVRIGNQVWMAENLRVTRYNDGSAIPLVESYVTWPNATTPMFSYYYNHFWDTTNLDSIKKFGAFYNWYVVNPENPRKIAPAGWHVPADTEWVALEVYLTRNGYDWDETVPTILNSHYINNKIAKSLAAKTDWQTWSSTPGAIGNDLTKNNRSGFSALPAGYRYGGDGYFEYQGNFCAWWSTYKGTAGALYWELDYAESSLMLDYDSLGINGCSIRLIRDN